MGAGNPIVFPYSPAIGKLSPIIPVGILLQGQWRVADMYVDSGAFYTLIHAQFGLACGLDYKKGRKTYAQVGDGSLIPIYLHRLPLQIGTKCFTATVGFSEKLGVRFNLLGRQDVFEQFTICFQEKHRIVSFQPVS
jgi:hypothetical protein